MAHWHVGETRTLTAYFAIGNTATDTPQITFKYKIGKFGTETTKTPTHDGTGNYSVIVTPDTSGKFYARWDTDGTYDTVNEPVYFIKPSEFE